MEKNLLFGLHQLSLQFAVQQCLLACTALCTGNMASGVSKTVQKILESLLRNENFSKLFENNFSDVLEIIVRDTCHDLALEIDDLISLKISLASLGCITELAWQLLGTETGTAGIQHNGEYLCWKIDFY